MSNTFSFKYANVTNNSDALREKCANTEFFLVRIFLYSVRIQEKTPYLDTFHAVMVSVSVNAFISSLLIQER